jgi:hypothetical protein
MQSYLRFLFPYKCLESSVARLGFLFSLVSAHGLLSFHKTLILMRVAR